MATLGVNSFNISFASTLIGTASADNIYGFGGNDVLWGGFGNDYMSGGSGDDQLYAGDGTWNYNYWGNDTALGGDGNDWINFYYTLSDVKIYGDQLSYADASTLGTYGDGRDTMYGGWGNDEIVGGGGNDTIYGGAGRDMIAGDYWQRNAPGFNGSDIIVGGQGNDYIVTGGGDDTIVINNGDSYAWYGGGSMDTIVDFNSIHDHIDLPGQVYSWNYIEAYMTYGGWDNAVTAANSYLKTCDYVFLTDRSNGYLFADTNGDTYADIGVLLAGQTSLNDFSYYNIV